jgi:hypothetical protein
VMSVIEGGSSATRDEAFTQMFRFTPEEFELLYSELQRTLPDSYFDVRDTYRTKMTFRLVLLMLLYHLSQGLWCSPRGHAVVHGPIAGVPLRELAALFRVSVGTVNHEVTLLETAFTAIKHIYIYMPWSGEQCRDAAEGFSLYQRGAPHLSNIIGAVDATYVFLRNLGDFRAAYSNQKHAYAATQVLAIVDAYGFVRFLSEEYPGSRNDDFIFSELDRTDEFWMLTGMWMDHQVPEAQRADWRRMLLEMERSRMRGQMLIIPRGYQVIGDKGYHFRPHVLPMSKQPLTNAFLDRIDAHRLSIADARELEHSHQAVDKLISSPRQAVERVFGNLKSTFRVLVTRQNDHSHKRMIVITCCCLHNIRRRLRLNSGAVRLPTEEIDRRLGMSGWVPGAHTHLETRWQLAHRYRAVKRERGSPDDDPEPRRVRRSLAHELVEEEP